MKKLKNKILTSLSFASVAVAMIGVSEGVVAATGANTEVATKMFALHLGATRVVYNLNSPGETLTVINDQDYPMLVQSEVLAEDQLCQAAFVVIPPFF